MSRKKEKLSVKEEDVNNCMQLLSSIAQSFSMMAGFMLPQLRQLGCDLKPAWYYPEGSDSIYLGYKLKLPNKESAEYFAECLKQATKRLSKQG